MSDVSGEGIAFMCRVEQNAVEVTSKKSSRTNGADIASDVQTEGMNLDFHDAFLQSFRPAYGKICVIFVT
jgi:hypothetical protein